MLIARARLYARLFSRISCLMYRTQVPRKDYIYKPILYLKLNTHTFLANVNDLFIFIVIIIAMIY
jgi:hypothetical protein